MTLRPNPYVGPRAFDVGAPLYGRTRELRQLKSLLVAERIVLLYSPSGAGKTSLIQAGLIPSLPKNFNILPIIRVNLEPPDELRDIAGFNRYIFSTLIALEDAQPVEQRLPIADLATLGLDTYIEQRLPAGDMVLIFDQFEEILTVSSAEREAKTAFFDALGDALRNPDCWALFSMREDFIGALDPYLRPIPGQMESRYRLDLLKADAAREAIQSPPRQQGVTFTQAAAEKLVRDLSRVQTQDIKGTTREVQGEYVEPVQLQVVCFNLWQNLSDDTPEIDETDLAEVGSIDESLASYYASTVANVAAATGTSERDLRTWFDSKLLLTGPANQPVRGQVRKGPESTEGLVNAALDDLVDAHIIRAEPRAGAVWYELAHDRLIGPVRSDNTRWFDAKLKLFQHQALFWDQQGHVEGLLLHGKQLVQAESEAQNLYLTPIETAFLESSQVLRKREQRERRNSRIRVILLVIAMIATIFAVVFGINAYLATQEANKQASAAQTSALELLISKDFRNSLLLAIESFRFSDTPQTRGVLLDTAAAYPQLRQFITGHTNYVAGVAFSPDGKMLASASYDSTIRLWDASTTKPIGQPLTGHTNGVNCVAFSPDGKTLASGSLDKTIILWDVATRKAIGQPLNGHKEMINNVVFSPDGKILASSSDDATIMLWDVATGKVIGPPLIGHAGQVTSVAFSPDGKMLASGNADKTIILWDLATRKIIGQPFAGHTNYVNTVAFSPDGKTLASGSWDTTIILWDVATGKMIGQPLTGHTSTVWSVAFSPDGNMLASGSLDKTVMLWSVASGKVIGQPLIGHAAGVATIAFSPDGKNLASGSMDNTIILWDISTLLSTNVPASKEAISQLLTGHVARIWSVAFSPDGKTLASGSSDGSIILWNVSTRKAIGSPLIGHTASVNSVAFSPDGKTLASGSNDGTIILWDVSTRKSIGSPITRHTGTVTSIAFSADSKTLASGSLDSTIMLWDVSNFINRNTSIDKAIGQPLPGNTNYVFSIAFSPDGKTLASGGNDGSIILWDVSTSKAIGLPLKGRASFIRSVAFSPDGKMLASGSDDDAIILWDVSMHKAIGSPLVGHKTGVSTVAFSPDGKTLASGGDDGATIFWDLAAGIAIGQPLTGYKAPITSMAFSPDGKILASSSWDWTILLRDMDPVSWIAESCQRAGGNFTLADWKRYFPNEVYHATCPQWRSEQSPTSVP